MDVGVVVAVVVVGGGGQSVGDDEGFSAFLRQIDEKKSLERAIKKKFIFFRDEAWMEQLRDIFFRSRRHDDQLVGDKRGKNDQLLLRPSRSLPTMTINIYETSDSGERRRRRPLFYNEAGPRILVNPFSFQDNPTTTTRTAREGKYGKLPFPKSRLSLIQVSCASSSCFDVHSFEPFT